MRGGDLPRRAAQFRRPVLDDSKIIILVERIERHPQTEAFRQGDFLLGSLARMDLFAQVFVLEIFLHVLGHQVAPVGSGVDQHVFRSRGNRAVEHDFQRLVARLCCLEGQVIAKYDEALAAPGDLIDDVGQVDQVMFVYFDQA